MFLPSHRSLPLRQRTNNRQKVLKDPKLLKGPKQGGGPKEPKRPKGPMGFNIWQLNGPIVTPHLGNNPPPSVIKSPR